MNDYIIWNDRVIQKELRTRGEGRATVFEYRLDGGEWKETHRIVWPEKKLNFIQKLLSLFR